MDEIQERRGPGRPPKYVTETQVNPLAAASIEPPRQRPNRKPFGTLEQTMAYETRAGYHRHWFNDVKDRISRAQEAGYEHVKDKEGKNVQMVVGTAEGGGPMHGFLMEILEEWYKEDMAAQQKIVDDREAQIKRGEAERQAGDGRYIPAQGISIKHGS
jgi:hypothetical protein